MRLGTPSMGRPARTSWTPKKLNPTYRFGAKRKTQSATKAATLKKAPAAPQAGLMQAIHFAARSHPLFFDRRAALRQRPRILAIVDKRFLGVTDLRAAVG